MIERGDFGMEQAQIEQRFLLNGEEYVLTNEVPQMTWGEGAIQSAELSADQRERFLTAITESLVVVGEQQLAMSGCTDGRIRLGMVDGSNAPVLEKNVGCDVVEMLIAAEVLGKDFYGEVDGQPLDARVDYLLRFMVNAGLRPTTHIGCGAREGLLVVKDNLITYADDTRIAPVFAARIDAFGGTNSREMLPEVAGALRQRDLSGYDPDLLLRKIITVSGESAVKRLDDDGKGVHGHTEAAIVHIDAEGYAHSTRMMRSILAGGSNPDPEIAGLEAFSVNDNRILRLAQIMAKGDATARDLSLVAMHAFGDAGHATLSKGLPTYLVRAA